MKDIQQQHPLYDNHGRIMQDRLYTTNEAAIILGVADSTLRRWRADEVGPRVTRIFPKAPARYRGLDLLQCLERNNIGGAA